MKFKRHLQLEYGPNHLDAVPLINIVLLLLVFFLLSSGFIAQSGMNINLSKVITSSVLDENNINITLGSGNVFYIEGKPVTIGELKELLKKLNVSKGSVLIKADSKAYLGNLVEIWNLCREMGLERVNVVTAQESKSR